MDIAKDARLTGKEISMKLATKTLARALRRQVEVSTGVLCKRVLAVTATVTHYQLSVKQKVKLCVVIAEVAPLGRGYGTVVFGHHWSTKRALEPRNPYPTPHVCPRTTLCTRDPKCPGQSWRK